MDQLRMLQRGRQYTLVKFSAIGFPYLMPFVLTSLRYGMDSSSPDSYMLLCKCPQVRSVVLDASQPFIIWDGIVFPDIDRIVSRHIRDYDSGPVTVGRSWPGFDHRYMQKAKDSISREPLISNFKLAEFKQGELFGSAYVLS